MPSSSSQERNYTQDEGFKTSRIEKSELARLYNITPDALRRRLNEKPGLMDELLAMGYIKTQREFTKQQVETIIKYLGEPYY